MYKDVKNMFFCVQSLMVMYMFMLFLRMDKLQWNVNTSKNN